jgi:hypothetical protein
VHDNFEPRDRLAVVAINKRSGAVVQRIAPAERIEAEDFQSWLRYMNDNSYEVYISMNALRDDARGRTKDDVAGIRHVYLDLDERGEEALKRLLEREDLPKPNYVVSSSPGRFQVIWKAEGFTRDQAEELQQHLARETGADIAVTDSSRVMRIPGFYNHKYQEPHLVTAEALSDRIHRPEDFPGVREADRAGTLDERTAGTVTPEARPPGNRLSQSERDWAYARRALARGEPRDAVVATIAEYRKNDKYQPQRYAERTVDKAISTLKDKARYPTSEQPTPSR